MTHIIENHYLQPVEHTFWEKVGLYLKGKIETVLAKISPFEREYPDCWDYFERQEDVPGSIPNESLINVLKDLGYSTYARHCKQQREARNQAPVAYALLTDSQVQDYNAVMGVDLFTDGGTVDGDNTDTEGN